MKKTNLLLGIFSLSALLSQAQLNGTRTGFKDDFSSATEYTDVKWGSTQPGAYTLTRNTTAKALDVTFTQAAAGYNDMEVAFGLEADSTTPKTIDLSKNADYFVIVQNTNSTDDVMVVAMYARDINNNTIDYDTPAGTWDTRICGMIGKGETDTITKGGTGFNNIPDFTLSGTFIGGGNIYAPNAVCDLTKITHIRFRVFNATVSFTNAKFRIKYIAIGSQIAGINDMKSNNETIKMYPNPVTNGVVNFSEEVKNITIYNNQGILVKNIERAKTINVSDLSSGIYIINTSKGQAKFIVK